MRHQRFLLVLAALVAAAQIGVLYSMIAGRAAILRDGREITLEVRPVDPRDLLRGDYVSLSYDISALPETLFAGQDPTDSDTRIVWVRLRPDAGGLHRAIAARYGAPPAGAPAAGEVDLRGHTYVAPGGAAAVPVDYGLERFYLPEGEGKPIEQGIGTRPFRMKVAVALDGTGQVKAFLDGERLIFEELLY